MSDSTNSDRQRIIPYLYYEDGGAALEFLCKAFGFEEIMRMPGPDGGIMHAEVGYQGNVVMLATTVKEMGYASPKDLPSRHGIIMCYVDEVDAHHAQAKAAGAKIVRELEDQFYGDRTYTAEDLEGHHWVFATHNRDIAPEDMRPPGS